MKTNFSAAVRMACLTANDVAEMTGTHESTVLSWMSGRRNAPIYAWEVVRRHYQRILHADIMLDERFHPAIAALEILKSEEVLPCSL